MKKKESISAWFNRQVRNIRKKREKRIREAGPHKCTAVQTGAVSRVTGRNDRILKRPVVIMRFYECEICGRDMSKVAKVKK